jgi:hypothetical protein
LGGCQIGIGIPEQLTINKEQLIIEGYVGYLKAAILVAARKPWQQQFPKKGFIKVLQHSGFFSFCKGTLLCFFSQHGLQQLS